MSSEPETRRSPRPEAAVASESRTFRVGATLVVTALAVAYIVAKIDIGKCVDILRDASIPWLALSAFLTVITVPPQAWRWQLLLKVRGVFESLALAHPRLLRLVRGRPGAADRGRRRRLAHLRDDQAPSRLRLADRRARCCSSARSAAR